MTSVPSITEINWFNKTKNDTKVWMCCKQGPFQNAPHYLPRLILQHSFHSKLLAPVSLVTWDSLTFHSDNLVHAIPSAQKSFLFLCHYARPDSLVRVFNIATSVDSQVPLKIIFSLITEFITVYAYFHHSTVSTWEAVLFIHVYFRL